MCDKLTVVMLQVWWQASEGWFWCSPTASLGQAAAGDCRWYRWLDSETAQESRLKSYHIVFVLQWIRRWQQV